MARFLSFRRGTATQQPIANGPNPNDPAGLYAWSRQIAVGNTVKRTMFSSLITAGTYHHRYEDPQVDAMLATTTYVTNNADFNVSDVLINSDYTLYDDGLENDEYYYFVIVAWISTARVFGGGVITSGYEDYGDYRFPGSNPINTNQYGPVKTPTIAMTRQDSASMTPKTRTQLITDTVFNPSTTYQTAAAGFGFYGELPDPWDSFSGPAYSDFVNLTLGSRQTAVGANGSLPGTSSLSRVVWDFVMLKTEATSIKQIYLCMDHSDLTTENVLYKRVPAGTTINIGGSGYPVASNTYGNLANYFVNLPSPNIQGLGGSYTPIMTREVQYDADPEIDQYQSIMLNPNINDAHFELYQVGFGTQPPPCPERPPWPYAEYVGLGEAETGVMRLGRERR